MVLVPVSQMRQVDHPEANRIEREAIERASTFCLVGDIADMDAGDKGIGTLLYDSEYMGGYIEIAADDDGTVVIEKWDDVSGSGSQTSISAIATIDGGVDLRGALTTLGTSASVCAAGYKIAAKTGVFDAAKVGRVVLFFKLVDDLGEDG